VAKGAIATSAATGEGIDALRSRIAEVLVPSVPPPGVPVPVTQRQVDCLRRLASATSEAAALAALHSLRLG
jgi:tRNA U34 5-carboxymethylaminomethyl modifying GTPase MnmE/TrmE